MAKVEFLSFNKLIPCDDRDSYLNKRIDCIGPLFGSLTFQCFNKISNDIKNYIKKEINSGLWNINENYEEIINDINIHKMIKSSHIENCIKSSMATGNWGLKNTSNKHEQSVQTPSQNL